jgi:hypothetical protein
VHVVHATLPIVLLNVPLAHWLHGPPIAPVKPTMQSQLGAPGLETVFEGQTEHAAVPT